MSFWQRSSYPIYQLLRFGTMLLPGILMARWGYGKEMIGDWEHVLMVSTAFSFFWVGGFSGAFAVLGKGKGHALLIRVFLVASVLTSAMGMFMFPDLLFWQVVLRGIFVFLISFSFTLETWCIANQAEKSLFRFGVWFYPFVWIFMLLGVWYSLSIDALLAILCLIFACKVGCFFVLIRAETRVDLRFETLWIHAWPIGLSLVAGGAGEFIDAILVRQWFGNGSFAVFRYGARELPVVPLLANALSMSFLSRLKSSDGELSVLQKTSVQYLRIFTVVGGVLIWVSSWIFSTIMNPDFGGAALYLNVFILIIPLRFLFPQTVLLSHGHSKVILWITVAELILNVLISLALLPVLGILGIVLGTVIAAWIERMVLLIYCKKLEAVSMAMLTHSVEWILWVVLLYANFLVWYFTQIVA